MSRPSVHARGVAKRYGDLQALSEASLDVRAGEIVGFVGPNGSGKTTCLRILDGILERDAGEVEVAGLDPGVAGVAVRRRCSYLPGETSLYLGMSGRAVLDFAWGFYPRLQHDLADEMRERFALPLDRKVREYSAGMKQKLALLAALVPDVAVYLLDEPDRALDASHRLWLREVLANLRDRGKAVLLSSHHLSEVEALAGRLVFLVGGRTVDEARVRSARELLRREIRLRLKRRVEWPDGVELCETLPDGSFRVRTRGEPLAWLHRLPAEAVEAAEVGVVRLERLYRLLAHEAGAPPC